MRSLSTKTLFAVMLTLATSARGDTPRESGIDTLDHPQPLVFGRPSQANVAGDASLADASVEDVPRTVAVDDPWERGRSTLASPRPKSMRVRACGFRTRICVHGPQGSEREVLDVLEAGERAHAILTGALRLPSPDREVATGTLDVYLVDGPGDDARTRLSARDPMAVFDRANAFVELPRALAGCSREAAIFRGLARAVLMRVAPAANEGLAIATANHYALLGVGCAPARLDDIAAFQREPTRSIVDPGDDPLDARFSRGAGVFFDWADVRFGAEPGGLVRASFALMATKSAPGVDHFFPRPDLFDVLRTSFKEALSVGSSLDDLLFRFAGARATLGPFVDATTLVTARTWSDAAKIKVEHAIDWPEKPRRFLSPKPIAPTGVTVFAVRRQGAASGTRLRLEAEWEEHARFRFMAIKLAPNGAALGTVLVPATPRATSAQSTITELDGTDTVLLVAMNSGDFARPFDPDDGAWERHAFLLTLASE